MGQHRIQRAMLNNFAFAGPQMNSKMVWVLEANGQRPYRKSTRNTGFFDIECSPGVDELVSRAEQHFRPVLTDLGKGNFSSFHNGEQHRKLIHFIAFHYVRSNSFSNQVSHLTAILCDHGLLSPDQAALEAARLTSHQHRETYIDLTNAVASCLTYFTFFPLTITGASNFITSDNILGVSQTPSKGTSIWFPVGSHHAILAEDESSTKQILGPTKVSNGRITFLGVPESPILKIQDTTPHEREARFFASMNSYVAKGSKVLFAHTKEDIDLAITSGTEDMSQYVYTPPSRNIRA